MINNETMLSWQVRDNRRQVRSADDLMTAWLSLDTVVSFASRIIYWRRICQHCRLTWSIEIRENNRGASWNGRKHHQSSRSSMSVTWSPIHIVCHGTVGFASAAGLFTSECHRSHKHQNTVQMVLVADLYHPRNFAETRAPCISYDTAVFSNS